MGDICHLYVFVAILGWLSAICIGALYLRLLVYTNNDLTSLVSAIKNIISRHSNYNNSYTFRHALIQRAWDNIKLLRVDLAHGDAERSTYGEVLNLSVDMAASGDKIEQSCEKLIEVLRIVGHEIIAAAVVLNDDTDKQLRVQALWGVPVGRIEETLIELFSSLIYDSSLTNWISDTWGYALPNKHDRLLDFGAFEIGMTLTVPLDGANGMVGGMWLGFKKGAASLTPERKVFLQAVATHAAATLYAARTASQRTAATVEQRDLIIGMSHDLRAPGNNALYGIRALLSGDKGSLTKEQYFDLTLVERALEEQQDILGDLFDYAKSQNGLLIAKTSSLDLMDSIEDLLESFAASALQNGLEFQVEPLSRSMLVDMHVLADLKHLRRIVSNLLSNALKYTDNGHIRVYCKLLNNSELANEDRGIVELRVEDTGIGVPESVCENELFSQFKRQANAGDRQGAGLGLAITKVLAEKNGGYVIFERNDIKGSTFGVGLVCEKRTSSIAVNVNKPNLDVHKCLNSKLIRFGKVLIAEDDEPTRMTMMRYLKAESDSVILASSCAEVRDLLKDVKVDLIITDFQLADELATSFLSSISDNIPVVICSGMSHLRERFLNINNAPIVVIEKPVGRKELLNAACDAMNLVNEWQ